VSAATRYVTTTAATGGTVLPLVVDLTEGVLKSMRLNLMIRIGGFVLASGLVLAGVGLLAARASGGRPFQSHPGGPQADTSAAAEKRLAETRESQRQEAEAKESQRKAAEAKESQRKEAEAKARQLEVAKLRTEWEIREVAFEVHKALLREALTRLGRLELERALRKPADQRGNDTNDIDRLSRFTEHLEQRVFELGIQAKIKSNNLQQSFER